MAQSTKRGKIGEVEVEVNQIDEALQSGSLENVPDRLRVRYELVIFSSPGKTPVFLAIESPQNCCREEDWRARLEAQARVEQKWDRHQTHSKVQPEETEWFEKRNNHSKVQQVKFITPEYGQGYSRRDGIHDSSVAEVDEAIKRNLGTTRNVASEYLKNGLESKPLDLKTEEVFEQDKIKQAGSATSRSIADEYKERETQADTKTKKAEPAQKEPMKQLRTLAERFKQAQEVADTLMDVGDLANKVEQVKKRRL